MDGIEPEPGRTPRPALRRASGTTTMHAVVTSRREVLIVHELALAEAVVRAALDTAVENGISRLSRIVVQIGELQSIQRETFEFALREVMPASEPRIAATRIDLELEPARFRCRPCGRAFALADTEGFADEETSEAVHFIPELAHAFVRCPDCNSPDFEVTAGRGVLLRELEGD